MSPMRIVTLGCCIVVMGATIVRAGGGPAVRAPQFAICPQNIHSVFVVKDEASDQKLWRMEIKLNEVGTEQLRSFSEKHLGNVTELVFDGAVLLRERIQSTIGSGLILTGGWHSGEAATEVMMLFGNRSLGVPCGPLPTDKH